MGKPAANAYVEMHARSAFSFLRASSLPSTLAARAAEVGLSALALTDRDGFYACPRLWTAAGQAGVRAIYGCELTMEDRSVLPLLVRSADGYQNLCRLLTRSKLRCAKGESFVRWDELEEIAGGVICLTGDEEGPLTGALLRRDFAEAEGTMRRLISIFGVNNVYVEVQRHLRRGERWLNARLIELADTTGAELLATNGVLYAEPAARRIVDVFTCTRLHTHLDKAGTALAVNGERHLKSPEQMGALFADLPDAVANSALLAERIEFAFPAVGYEFPSYTAPDGKPADAFLREVTFEGARRRYGDCLSSKVRRQLERELNLIIELGFTGYFLLVWDIINFCKASGILAQGRGSAANSAVCYCLEITAVDPIESRLLFERFLNENRSGAGGGRKAWPDIDLDLPSGERRERVIQEMYRRCGRNGIGMVANVITFKGKSTMREIGKALHLPADALDRFSGLFASGDYPHTMHLQDQFERSGLDRTHPRAWACLELFQSMRGLPRHLGQHSGGMVFCQHRLDSVVPLENSSMPGRSVVQWDKDDCEEMGIVKVDLLGLGMIAVIQDTLELCHSRGRSVDLPHLPKDDEPTFAAMRASDTIGVFQIESRAQMAALARLQPRCFYDVVVEVAIVRPGPIEGGLMHPYLARREGLEPVTYLDDRLKPILARTLGVCLFQEQMMSIAMVLGGFSGAEVDELRRALNYKRDLTRLTRVQAKLCTALQSNGVPPGGIEEIVKMTQSFALYGFPESHAISFGLLAYASTFLKVHRAAEFTAALLNNQPMGFYAPSTLVRDARAHGIRILPVCVQRSDWLCTVEADHVLRLGFNQVQGVRQEHAAELMRQRDLTPFRTLVDFRARVPMSKNELRALARLGALNSLCGHRRGALWEVERDLPVEENLLFCFDPPLERVTPNAPLPPMNPVERMQADYRSQGLTIGPHPMRLMRDQLPDVWKSEDIAFASHGEEITIAGAVICRQRPGTAKGFVFISLEDESGVANAVVPPDLFERVRLTITQEKFLRITGIAQTRQGLPLVRAERIERLTCPSLTGVFSHDFH
jgi:error-prone DNA polymerase